MTFSALPYGKVIIDNVVFIRIKLSDLGEDFHYKKKSIWVVK